MILWIILAIVIVVFVKYIYLIIKRFQLLRKIGHQIKRYHGSIQYCRNPIISIFKHDGEADISLQLGKKVVDISIVTTPLCRVRYHFDINNKLLELIIERRAIHVINPKVPRTAGVMDRVYTIRKYKMDFSLPNNNHQKYVILNPAPKSVSKADGAALTVLYDNDDLIPNVKVCGLKWFVQNIISL